MKPETIAIRTQTERSQFGEHSTPIHLTSSYTFDNAEEMRALFAEEVEGNIYSRYSNPTVSEFINKLALLEGLETGWATASGMAAVFSTFAAFLKQGDHVVACRSVFGSTHKLIGDVFPKWGVSYTYVDFDDIVGFDSAIKENTKMIYIETPSNPALDIIDMQAIGAICKAKDVLFVVDNCFATPVIQQPAKFGANIVIHSATKWIDGQGRTMGGAILGSKEAIKTVENFARHSGPCLSPFNAWVLSKSLETLDVRLERHCSNALRIAQNLEESKDVNWVKYPHLKSHPSFHLAVKQMRWGGGIVTFELKGGLEAGRRFLDKLSLFSLTANLGDTRSIASHPASTTHARLTVEERKAVGISDGLIRLSIGLEHYTDIWEDISNAIS